MLFYQQGFALSDSTSIVASYGFITKVYEGAVYGSVQDFNLPVLVETATALFGQVLGPNVDQSTWTVRCFDVADGTNNDNWWSFQDGDGFNNFLLVDF